jgi:TonB family protein
MKHIIFTFIIGIFCISIPLLSQKKDDFSSRAETIFDKAPVPIKRVEPKYPVSMLKDNWESNVYLNVFVNVDGNVADVKIEKIDGSSPNELQGEQEVAAAKKEFQEAACTAVRQWKFSPAQMQGKPVAVWVTIPIRFKLSTVKETKPKDKVNRMETEKRVESIKTPIENILKGIDITQAKKYIIPDAYLIYGKYYENLYGVLNGEHKNIKLIEGPESKGMFFHITISDDETNAWMFFKTQIKTGGQSRFHTVILIKSENGDWQIKHWHVS